MIPYDDTFEHLLAELQRLDLLLRLHLEEWWADNEGTVDEFRGLYVSDEEVNRLLQAASSDGVMTPGDGAGATDTGAGTDSGPGPGPGTGSRTGRGHDVPDPLRPVARATREIRERKRLTLAEGTELRLVTLSELFDLDDRHVDALLIGLAPEVDRKYETVYSYLQDDVTRKRPTVGLALDLLCNTEADRLAARTLFSPQSPLVRNRLLSLTGDGGTPLLSRFIHVDERIVAYLLGSHDLDDRLAGLAELQVPEQRLADLVLDGTLRTSLEQLSTTERERRDTDSPPIMTYFHGPYGSGKRVAAEALCAETGTPLLTADGGTIRAERRTESLARLLREARLQGAALSVRDLTPDPDESESALDLTDVVRELDGFNGRVFMSGTEPLPARLPTLVADHDFVAIEFPTPSHELRTELWRRVDALPDDVDPATLAGTFQLTAGQIADAVSTAETAALARGDPVSAADVYAGCRAQAGENLGSLSRKIEPHYTWDDIVLPADKLAHLREVAAHITHRSTVYAEWGFGEKFTLGNGLVVLFTGASGTGKTMAAEIIAGDAGLDLYKIDLSTVVSKYIGETEKNLGRIFDEAEDSNAILLFDEADALFGKRSEVSDAHDRYANIEVNYLLQRVEEHDGPVILTTNFRQNIDDAFLRRIHLSVDFPRPNRELRAAIWRSIFPEATPVDELDIEFLSSLELTGGNIKNIALTAAFLAADEGGSVGMTQVLRAVRREFQKTGRLTRPEDFGKYRDSVTQ